jgi:hypothetical protein
MYLNCVLDGQHIGLGQYTDSFFKSRFVGSHDLIGHRFATLSVNMHYCFSWVLPPYLAGHRHNHYPRKIPVGSIIAHDDCWARLANFTADSRIKFNPPYFTALH